MSVIQQHLGQLIIGQDLTSVEMEAAMDSIMQGEATPAQIAGFIVALRMKGETVDELAAAARVMRKLSSKVDLGQQDLVDTCGTGGDGQKTFNISTASAIVAASAGVKIAKHGNRSVSSKTGSADVLETLGVRLDVTPEVIANCVRQVGIGFMFAPMHHSCMKHAIGPRKELAVRTLFNLLGPLTNPAGAKRQVMGVFDDVWLEPLAKVLDSLGGEHCLVVHADDGLDEISISAATQVCELNNGQITRFQIQPEDFGLQRADASAIRVENAAQSAQMIRAIFAGEQGPAADIVSLNAGAAIYIAKQAPSLSAGIEIAASQLQSGAAAKTLAALIEFTTTAA
ncbi:MAG: anthranilate phosphoribosyltransferase [Gammaproteobacteria bacterium]|nr:anthranilate phosphoribosyltransferase [Gammaproteobacteria bacterium]